MNDTKGKATTYKFRKGQPVMITGGKHIGKVGKICCDEPIRDDSGEWYPDLNEWWVSLTKPGEGSRWVGIAERDIEGEGGEPAKPDHSPDVPGLFPIGSRVQHKYTGHRGVVIDAFPLRDRDWRTIRFDDKGPGAENPWSLSIKLLEPEVIVTVPAKPPKPEPATHQWTTGDRVFVRSGETTGNSGVILHVIDSINAYLIEYDRGPSRGKSVRIVKADRMEVPDDMQPSSPLHEVDEVGPAKPDPVVHQWATGDEAVLYMPGYQRFDGKTAWLRERVEPRSVSRKAYWTVGFTPDSTDIDASIYEWALRRPEPSPAPQPEPPATILYRVEYRTTQDVVDLDAEGNWEPSIVAARKAALVPIAGIAERLKLAEALAILHGYEGDYDDSVVAQLGGVAADPFAVGDRVTIVGGEHAGDVWYLVVRNEANGQYWWLSRERDGMVSVGLHVDRFERDERGDG